MMMRPKSHSKAESPRASVTHSSSGQTDRPSWGVPVFGCQLWLALAAPAAILPDTQLHIRQLLPELFSALLL